MLIGTTVIGLQRMMRVIRLAQKQKARAAERNKNIYEPTVTEDGGKNTEGQDRVFDQKIVNLRETLKQDKNNFISWMMHAQANNNAVMEQLRNAEQERSFALRAAQKAEAQKVVGL